MKITTSKYSINYINCIVFLFLCINMCCAHCGLVLQIYFHYSNFHTSSALVHSSTNCMWNEPKIKTLVFFSSPLYWRMEVFLSFDCFMYAFRYNPIRFNLIPFVSIECAEKYLFYNSLSWNDIVDIWAENSSVRS